MKPTRFSPLEANSTSYYGLLGLFALFVLIALAAAHHMESEGHYVTGMTNQIVWGTPHIFAVFLIVAASGALNVASIGTVFGVQDYKPLSRLSALLAIALLVGGLSILVLDLGRPDRLIVAMTYYNFKSIFAWNIFLYTGFLVIVAVYLWTMMEGRFNRYSKYTGYTAFIWRLILTTGTGSIFGFLVARQAYDAAIMAPIVVMSFSFGLAVFILVLMAAYKWSNRPLGDVILLRLKNLLGVFIGAVMYFVLAYHLTNLYVTENHGVEEFILLGGNVYTMVFWFGQILLGSLAPLALLYLPQTGKSRTAIVLASILVILGGFAQLYVIIIGGQAYPLNLFPGMEESSSFFDGVVASYTPSIYEFLLGLGGIAIAMVILTFGLAILSFLPESLSDSIMRESPAKSAKAAG